MKYQLWNRAILELHHQLLNGKINELKTKTKTRQGKYLTKLAHEMIDVMCELFDEIEDGKKTAKQAKIEALEIKQMLKG